MLQGKKFIPVYVLADSSVSEFELAAIKKGVKECAPVFGCLVFICLFGRKWGNGQYDSADMIIRRSGRKGGRIDASSALTIMGKAAKSFKYPGIMILFTANDLSCNDTWCFGAARSENMCTIQSTYRYQRLSDGEFARCVARTLRHELGHIFNCAGDTKRTNTIDKFGSHCTNPNCSMRQTVNLNELVNAAMVEDPKSCFCEQCVKDMRRFKWDYECSHVTLSVSDLGKLGVEFKNSPG